MTIALEKLTEADRIRIAESLFEVKSRSEGRGELMGLCPIHGESNPSFQYNYKKDTYFCFACGVKGDLPGLYMTVTRNTFGEFCRLHGISGDGNHESKRHNAPVPPGRSKKPSPQSLPLAAPDSSAVEDLELWRKRAASLVEYTEKALVENAHIIKWLRKRGISKKTATTHHLGWLETEKYRQRAYWGLVREIKKGGKEKKLWIPAGLVIPLFESRGEDPSLSVRRIRIRRFADTEPKYVVLPGPPASCMALGMPARAAVVVENWLDAIMLHSKVAEMCAVVGTGSATARPDAELRAQLRKCGAILVALDFGDEKGAGTKGWEWWRDAFPAAAKRWPVPVGKDAGEAFEAGVSMTDWVKAGLPRGWFLGPYPTGLVIGRTAECELTPAAGPAPEQKAAQENRPPGDAIEELASLLREHPVQIRVASDGSRIWIRESQDWKRRNWKTSKHISELVFRDCAVLDHIMRHGAEIIDGKNIMGGGK